jgi:uncharacterized protein with FMN-binding domain
MKRKIITPKNIVLAVVLLLLIFFLRMMSWGIPKQDNTLYPMELSGVSDGVYEARYTIVPPFGTFVANRTAVVSVTIENHRVAAIETSGSPAMSGIGKQLAPRIVDKHTVDLDGISGATWSKKAFLKAVEKAVK